MEAPRLRQEVLASFLRPGVVGILRHMWRVAGVGPRDIAIPFALALLISAAEGASFAFLIPLSDGVAAGSFVFLDGSPRFGWVAKLVPEAISPPDRDLALALVLLTLLLLGRFVKVALEFFRGWWLTSRDQRYFTAVGRETFRRVTSFGPLYFRRRPLAHIDAEISWAPTPIYVLGTLEALVANVLRLAAKIVLVLAISPLLFLFLLVSLAALTALTHQVSRRAGALADSAAGVYKVTRRESLDALANMSMVKALRQEATIQAGHAKRVDQAEGIRAQTRRLGFLKSGLVETTVLLGALVGEGLILVFVPGSPALHLARFCAFFLVAQQCMPDLQEISANLFAFVKQAPELEALAHLFADEAKYVVPSGRRRFTGLRSGVTIQGLTFAYDPAVPVLEGVYAAVPACRVTALVGTSGSGKSTVADLLLRVYDCEPQSILFDGHDVREFDLGSFRDRTFLVSQDPWILGRSLRENLCFGLDTPPDDAKLWALLGDVALADDVAALPQGLDTELGDRGGSFSPGQRQRVALARVLLREVDLLVLDEATSALDSALEERVMVAIRRRLAGRTVVVIAHRFSTIRMADHVLVMEAGRIVESGPWEELTSREGAFTRLFARQLEGLADAPAGGVVAPRTRT